MFEAGAERAMRGCSRRWNEAAIPGNEPSIPRSGSSSPGREASIPTPGPPIPRNGPSAPGQGPSIPGNRPSGPRIGSSTEGVGASAQGWQPVHKERRAGSCRATVWVAKPVTSSIRLGQHPRRDRPVERDGQCDDWDVRRMPNCERTLRGSIPHPELRFSMGRPYRSRPKIDSSTNRNRPILSINWPLAYKRNNDAVTQ